MFFRPGPGGNSEGDGGGVHQLVAAPRGGGPAAAGAAEQVLQRVWRCQGGARRRTHQRATGPRWDTLQFPEWLGCGTRWKVVTPELHMPLNMSTNCCTGVP